MTGSLVFAAILFALILPSACAQEPDKTLIMISGDDQSGVPTENLDQPLVVRLVELLELEPTDDAYVYEQYPTNNYGDAAELQLGFFRVEYNTHQKLSLMKFDGTVNGNILSADLRVYCFNIESRIGSTHELEGIRFFKIGEDWDEDSIIYNDLPITGDNPPNWEEITGIDPTSITEGEEPYGQFNDYDIPVDLVSEWFQEPPGCYGICLYALPDLPLGDYAFAEIRSKEYTVDPSKRPKLILTTDDPGQGVQYETIYFNWSGSPDGPWTDLAEVITESNGDAAWTGPLPNPDPWTDEIWIRARYEPPAVNQEITFHVNLMKPIIEGTVFKMELMGPVSVGPNTPVTVSNEGEDIEFTVLTDGNGHYTTAGNDLIFPDGDYHVFAEVDECSDTLKTVAVSGPQIYTCHMPVYCYVISGSVRSPSGPVVNAELTLNDGEFTQYTDSAGEFRFFLMPGSLPMTYKVEAGKDGNPAYPDTIYVTLTEETPNATAYFCYVDSDDRGQPGDDLLYFPEHFSMPGFDETHFNLSGMPEESIDTFTGKVHLTYTDLHLPGMGGLDLNIQRTYSSCIKELARWRDVNLQLQKFVPETCLGLGWDLHFGKILNYNGKTPVIVMPDGSRHVAYEVPYGVRSFGYPKFTKELWRLDKINESGPYAFDLKLTLADGTQYYFYRSDFCLEVDGAECWAKEWALVSEIRSAGGSDFGPRIAVHYTEIAERMVIDYVVDSYDRAINFEYSPEGFLTRIRGPNNSKYLDYTVVQFGLLGSFHALETVIERAFGPDSDPGDMETGYAYNVDAGSPTHGVLTRIDLPAGGFIEYTHSEHRFYLKAFDEFESFDREYYDIVVESRSEKIGETVVGTTAYSIATYSPFDQYTYVHDALGNDTRYRYWNYYSTDLGDIAEWKIGLPAEIIRYDGAAGADIKVRTETHFYESRRLSQWPVLNLDREFVFIPVPDYSETILHGVQPKRLKIDYVYSGSNGDWADLVNFSDLGMPKYVTEYNFDALAERTTSYIYVWENQCPGFRSFRSANYLDGIHSEVVIAGDSGDEPIAKTVRDYFSEAGPSFTRLRYVTKWSDPGDPMTEILTEYRYYMSDPNVGNLYAIKDPEGKETFFEWNAGTISKIITPQLLPDSYHMTFLQSIDVDSGRVVGSTDPNGNRMSYEYDDLGRVTNIRPPADIETVFIYDLPNRQVTAMKGDCVSIFHYDGLGRLIQTVVPGDQGGPSYVNREYDATGNLSRVTEASFSPSATEGTSYLYGPLNRVTQASDPDGTTTYAYDGNVVEITRNTQVTTQTYDALGRLDQIEDADGKVFDYEYDVLGNLTRVDHPDDVTCADRVFVYDGLGRLTSETHPEAGTATYTYTDSGQVETVTKASGLLTSFTYDDIYRPLTQTSGTSVDTIEIEFYYDGENTELGYGGSYQFPVNHRTGAVVRKGLSLDEESRIIWPWFDEQGRNLRKESVLSSPSVTNVMEFGYDTMGNLTGIDYPDGLVTANYTYGASTNMLTGVSVIGSGGTINLAGTLSHNPAGGLESVTFGNGFITEITPDVRNRPDNWHTYLGLDDLLDNDFTYDAFGNITDIGADDFGYDPLNRLTSATVNGTS
ncbi:DNRLRE domain-containing protein, partial [bacterium]|nr:DNRLRE domain-containing protein [candidate division CSSED10-310 bacterium]